MEPWRVYRLMATDSHHFYEEQDPDPHIREKLDPDPHKSESWIRIRMKVKSCIRSKVMRSATGVYTKSIDWRTLQISYAVLGH